MSENYNSVVRVEDIPSPSPQSAVHHTNARFKYLSNSLQKDPITCVNICNIFLLFLLVLTLIGSVIVYYVYTIKALAETSYTGVKLLCPDSSIWLYIIVYIIAGVILQVLCIHKLRKSERNGKLAGLICNMLIISVFVGWGSYETWITTCNQLLLSNSLLYIMSKITVIMNIISLVINMVWTILTCIC